MLKLGNVLILGDSYSTFEGYIPEGYHTYYTIAEKPETDVCKKEQCWWSLLEEEIDGRILLNESHSGATVCNTERPTIIGTSFITRLDRMIKNGYFDSNKVDTVLILGGTNDSWIDSPIGEIIYEGFNEENKKDVLPAFAYLLTRLKEVVPDALILPIINTGLKPEITEGFCAIGEHLGAPCMRLAEIDKRCGHPTILGMRELKDQIIDYLSK